MNLETTFYIMAIVYMVLMIVIMVAASIYSFILLKRFEKFSKNLEEKVVGLAAPATILSVGSFLVKNVIGRLFKRRR